MNKDLVIVGLCLIFLIDVIFAIPIPSPHAFYGNVKYSNGILIEEGTIIAQIANITVGNSEIINGSYDLIVESDYGEIIYFYLEGKKESLGNYMFQAFEVTELNFIIEIPESESRKRSHKSSSYQPDFELFCEPNWKCSSWSECKNGLMTRQCRDTNFCEYSYNKPIEETGCEMTSKALIEEEENNWGFILFGIITPLILIIILIVLVSVKGGRSKI